MWWGKFDCLVYSLRVKIINLKVEIFIDVWGCVNIFVIYLNKVYFFFV